jgi:outer membrane protein assembly factor BamB
MLQPLLAALLLASAAVPAPAQDAPPAPLDPARQWPAWRGPLGTGVAPHGDPPITWSEDAHVRWKAPLPGKGHSTPVVWGERVLVTTAVPFGDTVPEVPDPAPGAHDNAPITQPQRFEVLCLDRKTGTQLWRRALHEELPHERAHNTGSFASSSPVTDGEYVFAFFGSRGLYCLDMEGWVLWEKQLGHMHTKHGHGEGAGPALFGDTLIVNWDHEGQSFLAAFERATGEERWRKERDEVTSWSTPIVVVHDGAPQIVVSGTQRVRGYALEDGALLWECGGLSHNVVASPVSAGGMVFAGSSYEKQSLVAIRLDGAKGDLSSTENLAWMRRRATPYVPSPLLYDGWLYFLHHYQGFLARVEAETGAEPEKARRLTGLDDVYASPAAAAGRIYLPDRSGVTAVLSHQARPEILALNELADSFSASPVIVGKELFLRGEHYLYCIADDGDDE